MSEVTRRDFQRLLEQVGRLELRIRTLENQLQSCENRLRPAEMLRTIKQQARDEKLGAGFRPELPPEVTGFLQPVREEPPPPAHDLSGRYPDLPPPLADL